MADDLMSLLEDEKEETSTPSDPNAVEVDSISVAGVITDKYGNTWQVPADDVDDLDDLGAINPFERMTFDPAFHYQLVGVQHLDVKRMEGLVPVLKEEVGLPAELISEYGKPTSSVVQFMDAVLCKIPKKLADRRRAARVKEAQRALEGIEPTEAQLGRARRPGAPEMRSNKASMAKLDRAADGAPAQVERTRRVSPHLTE